MGQEQSVKSKTGDVLLDGVTKQPTRRHTLSDQGQTNTDAPPLKNRIHRVTDVKKVLTSIDDQEQPRVSSQQDPEEEGIIYISSSSISSQDPILTRLQQLEPVRPLITDMDRSTFGLESLFDLSTAGIKALSGSGKESILSSSRPSSIKTNCTGASASSRTDPLVDIMLTLQSHINTNMARINLNQKRLLQRSKYVDDLNLKANQAISVALTQSRLASDRLNEAKYIKNHAKQTRHYATSIFEAMSRIQHLLDPEDRVGHHEFERRWPVLHILHQRANDKSGRPPAFLPSSSSSTNSRHESTQQHQQKTTTVTATINMATMTPLPSSETASESTYLVPRASSSSEVVDKEETQQHQLVNSSTLAMDHLRSLISDSAPPDNTTAAINAPGNGMDGL